VPGSRGAAACARAQRARARIFFFKKKNYYLLFIFILKPHPDI
jgi:hypothetical protein